MLDKNVAAGCGHLQCTLEASVKVTPSPCGRDADTLCTHRSETLPREGGAVDGGAVVGGAVEGGAVEGAGVVTVDMEQRSTGGGSAFEEGGRWQQVRCHR